ncbi:hypothetical protein [uncultured Roseibium sp.]|uniref:hypothetical protein n=1 Tax=uncultured Roseibium sp. TaxID=1936171 RepID=UPI0032165D69
MNLRIAITLFIITAFSQTVAMTVVSTAHASDRGKYSQFYYHPDGSDYPLLDAFFSYLSYDRAGPSIYNAGHLYIYCNKNKLSKFFFSSIIENSISEYYANKSGFILGIKKVPDDYEIPIYEFVTTEGKKEGLERLELDFQAPIYFEEVRYFTPTFLSENTSLYGQSYVEGNIVDLIQEPVLFVIGYYDDSEKYWNFLSKVLIKTDPKYVKQFVTACTPKEQPQ